LSTDKKSKKTIRTQGESKKS
jgi:hypothetical protein